MFNGGADQVVINRIAEIVAGKILPYVEKAVADQILEKMTTGDAPNEFEMGSPIREDAEENVVDAPNEIEMGSRIGEDAEENALINDEEANVVDTEDNDEGANVDEEANVEEDNVGAPFVEAPIEPVVENPEVNTLEEQVKTGGRRRARSMRRKNKKTKRQQKGGRRTRKRNRNTRRRGGSRRK